MSTFRGILAPPASVSSGSGNDSKKSRGWLGGSRRDETGESARRSRRTSGGRKASGGGGCDLAGWDLAGWDLAGWDLAGWDWLGWEDEGSDGSGGRAGEDQASVGGIFTNAAPAADIPIATSSRQPRGWTGIAQVRPAFLPSLLAAGRYRTPGISRSSRTKDFLGQNFRPFAAGSQCSSDASWRSWRSEGARRWWCRRH